jgi:hypothetical protein
MKYWWIGILLVPAAGCRYFSSTDQRLTDLAAEYCDCTAKLAELNQAAAGLAAHAQSDTDLTEKFQALQYEYATAKNCAAGLLTKYGAVTEEEVTEIIAILQKKCPAVAEQRRLMEELLFEP